MVGVPQGDLPQSPSVPEKTAMPGVFGIFRRAQLDQYPGPAKRELKLQSQAVGFDALLYLRANFMHI